MSRVLRLELLVSNNGEEACLKCYWHGEIKWWKAKKPLVRWWLMRDGKLVKRRSVLALTQFSPTDRQTPSSIKGGSRDMWLLAVSKRKHHTIQIILLERCGHGQSPDWHTKSDFASGNQIFVFFRILWEYFFKFWWSIFRMLSYSP